MKKKRAETTTFGVGFRVEYFMFLPADVSEEKLKKIILRYVKKDIKRLKLHSYMLKDEKLDAQNHMVFKYPYNRKLYPSDHEMMEDMRKRRKQK